jgi:hypothetical protein
MSDPISQNGSVKSTPTAFLQVYTLTAERLIYDSFKRGAVQDADPAAGTTILLEGYAMKGVEAVDPAGWVYSFRADRHLIQDGSKSVSPLCSRRICLESYSETR